MSNLQRLIWLADAGLTEELNKELASLTGNNVDYANSLVETRALFTDEERNEMVIETSTNGQHTVSYKNLSASHWNITRAMIKLWLEINL